MVTGTTTVARPGQVVWLTGWFCDVGKAKFANRPLQPKTIELGRVKKWLIGLTIIYRVGKEQDRAYFLINQPLQQVLRPQVL